MFVRGPVTAAQEQVGRTGMRLESDGSSVIRRFETVDKVLDGIGFEPSDTREPRSRSRTPSLLDLERLTDPLRHPHILHHQWDRFAPQILLLFSRVADQKFPLQSR